MYNQNRLSMWKVALLVALYSVALVNGKYKVSKERIEQIKREAKWVPYSYEEHPFKDEDDLLKRTGLLALENEAVPSG